MYQGKIDALKPELNVHHTVKVYIIFLNFFFLKARCSTQIVLIIKLQKTHKHDHLSHFMDGLRYDNAIYAEMHSATFSQV